MIAEQLPVDFNNVAPRLQLLAANWPAAEQQGWQNYISWPLINYAGKAGLTTPALALPLLAKLTPLFTAEFAIRPYLEQHFELTYRHMLDWTRNPDPHVRRLASEGLRPRLPWGKRLDNIPLEKALTLLNVLKDDDSVYVQKSVANHLNDLSKVHPRAVLSQCQRWQTGATPVRLWIIRRALRSLQKQADPAALALLGYQQDLPLAIAFQTAQSDCRLGGAVTLQLTLQNQAQQPLTLLIDYELWLLRANGRHSVKVFFWQRLNLPAGHRLSLNKQQPMQQRTTRKLYPGRHEIRLRINGQVLASQIFELRP